MERRTALYRIYAEDCTLLYVGIAYDVLARFCGHRQWSPWFGQAHSYTVAWFDTRTLAAKGERLAIQNEGPKHNVAMNKEWNAEAAELGKLLGELARAA